MWDENDEERRNEKKGRKEVSFKEFPILSFSVAIDVRGRSCCNEWYSVYSRANISYIAARFVVVPMHRRLPCRSASKRCSTSTYKMKLRWDWKAKFSLYLLFARAKLRTLYGNHYSSIFIHRIVQRRIEQSRIFCIYSRIKRMHTKYIAKKDGICNKEIALAKYSMDYTY